MYSENEFAGKVAVISGGTSGIGKAIVLALAAEKCRVYFCGRNEDRENVCKLSNGYAFFYRTDLTAADACSEYCQYVMEREGRIDYLINNVAYDGRLELEKSTEEDFERFFSVNIRTAISLTRAALDGLKAGAGKSVVNFGTTNWMLGLEPFTLYAAAKSGLLGFTRAAARELGRDGIRVNMLSPGWVMTPKQLQCYVTEKDKEELLQAQALKKLLTEEDIVAPLMFLLSKGAGAVTGQNLIVDGGKLMQ